MKKPNQALEPTAPSGRGSFVTLGKKNPMDYYGDKRDSLERLYPTCTSFCQYHPQYPARLIEATPRGVVFLLAWWSGPAIERFKFACYALEDHEPPLAFHVIDVDGLAADSPFEEKQKLGGYGEVFWVRDGAIVSSMGADWSKQRFDELLAAL
jgi:hypothetical protein